MLKLILLIIAAYFLGAIPTAYIITKLVLKKDIRKLGSCNVGATNVYRSVGKFYGILTLIIDIIKGFVAAKLAMHFIPDNILFQLLISVTAIIGHGYSIFMKGKGGKSVATTLGVFIALAYPAIFFTLIIFIATVGLFGYISVGSIASAIFLPIAIKVLEYDKAILIFSIILGIYIIYKHKTNIIRLIKGTENKFIKSL